METRLLVRSIVLAFTQFIPDASSEVPQNLSLINLETFLHDYANFL